MNIKNELMKSVELQHPSLAQIHLQLVKQCVFSPLTILSSFFGGSNYFVSWVFGGVSVFQNIGFFFLSSAVFICFYNLFFRFKKQKNRAVEKFYRVQQRAQKFRIEKVRRYLRSLSKSSETSDLAMQAGQQAQVAFQHFQTFQSVLKERLDPQELTYGRLNGTASMVLDGIMTNLSRIGTALRNISVDMHRVQPQRASSDKALHEREEIISKQMNEIIEALDANESALTTFAKTSAELGSLALGDGSAQDYEHSLEDLKLLAGRIKNLQS